MNPHNSRQKQLADLHYYNDPNYCEACNKVIMIKEKQSASRTCQRKYCDECLSEKRPWKNFKKVVLVKQTKICRYCGKSFLLQLSKSRNELSNRVICDECYIVHQGGPVKHNKTKNGLSEMTKGEVRKSSHTNADFRAKVLRHARTSYKKELDIIVCEFCGYSIYTEICHIQPVAFFENNVLIKEINNINNLVRLCPNHHKELDLELLDKDKLVNKILKLRFEIET